MAISKGDRWSGDRVGLLLDVISNGVHLSTTSLIDTVRTSVKRVISYIKRDKRGLFPLAIGGRMSTVTKV